MVDKTPDDDIDKAYFVIIAHNGPDLLMVGRMPQRLQPDGVMGQQFRGLWYMLTDGQRALTCPLSSFEPLNDQHTSFMASVPVQLRRPGSPPLTVEMTFHIQTDGPQPRGQLVYCFADTKQGPRYIRLQKGDDVRAIYTKVGANGELGTWVSEKAGITIDDPKSFTLGWGQIGKGAYQVGFEVVNLAGQSDLNVAELILQ